MSLKREGLKRQREIIMSFKYREWTYSLEAIPCSRPECTKCPHGRYWYLRGVVNGHKETFYLGGRLQIVSWKVEALGGLTFEDLYEGRKQRAKKKEEKENREAMERDDPKQ